MSKHFGQKVRWLISDTLTRRNIDRNSNAVHYVDSSTLNRSQLITNYRIRFWYNSLRIV